MSDIPRGVVAIFIAPNGFEGGVSYDFDQTAAGGMTLEMTQQHRAKIPLYRRIVANYASPVLAENIENYTAERIVKDMISKGGRIEYISIGHEEDKEPAQ